MEGSGSDPVQPGGEPPPVGNVAWGDPDDCLHPNSHHWGPPKYDYAPFSPQRVWYKRIVDQCAKCGTVRYRYITAYRKIVQRTYIYPEWWTEQRQGEGRIDYSERLLIFTAEHGEEHSDD